MLTLLAAAALASQPTAAELTPLMALYRELHAAPELAMTETKTAARLAPNDSQRIQRALEVWRTSGQPLSRFQRARRPDDASAAAEIPGR